MNNLPKIAIDIETMPNPDMICRLPEPTLKLGNVKDPEKIAIKKEEAKKAQIDKMALSPLWGEIACIGYCDENNSTCDIEEEKEMITNFLKTVVDKQIVTYNGKSFDLPFIYKRGIILGVEGCTIPALNIFVDRYKSQPRHIDVMEQFCGYGQYEKLDILGDVLLGENKLDFDFKKIPELLQTKEGKYILVEYCLKDCYLTWNLAKKMGLL